jgi:hypothetical protein
VRVPLGWLRWINEWDVEIPETGQGRAPDARMSAIHSLVLVCESIDGRTVPKRTRKNVSSAHPESLIQSLGSWRAAAACVASC